MANVRQVRETSRTLRFANSHWRGWIFVGVGAALPVFGIYTWGGTASWITLGFGLLTLAAGMPAVLMRSELTIDLVTRTYRGRRGYWPRTTTFKGSLARIERITLSCSERRRDDDGTRHREEWSVAMELPEWRRPLEVLRTYSESRADQAFAHYTKLLRRPGADLTRRVETFTEEDILDRLDELPAQEPAASGPLLDPPAQSSIRWVPHAGSTSIVLPRGGFNGWVWMLLFMSIGFLAFGVTLALRAVGLLALEVSLEHAVIGAVVFNPIGAAIMALVLLAVFGHQAVREDGDQLLFDYRLLAWTLHTERLQKVGIDRVVRMAVPSSKPVHAGAGTPVGPALHEVLVRSGDDLVRLARGVDEATQQWLCRTLQLLVAGQGEHRLEGQQAPRRHDYPGPENLSNHLGPDQHGRREPTPR